MADLGINADGRAAIPPSSLAALGSAWTRCVAYPDVDIRGWIQGCHASGVMVLLVLARESIGDDANRWSERIASYRNLYHGIIDAWQIGNEPDHVSDSSWTMRPDDLSQLLRTGRNVLGDSAYIVGAGLVSGNPAWAADVDWSPAQALAAHPYAKEPGSAELDSLIAGYAAYGLPLWVTEYHARSIGMAAALRDDPRLEMALAFCYTDRMVPGFGLIEDPAARADFMAAASGGQPVPDTFSVGAGMRALMAKRGDVPASDELYFKNGAGKDQFSEAVAASGRMYRYIFSQNKTVSYSPEAT